MGKLECDRLCALVAADREFKRYARQNYRKKLHVDQKPHLGKQSFMSSSFGGCGFRLVGWFKDLGRKRHVCLALRKRHACRAYQNLRLF
jgi:hypothetical protein